MTLKPLDNRILVKPDEKETKTAFGLIIQEETATKPTTGIVQIGNKDIKKGSKILFSKYGYDEVVIEKETFYVISQPNVLGIFT